MSGGSDSVAHDSSARWLLCADTEQAIVLALISPLLSSTSTMAKGFPAPKRGKHRMYVKTLIGTKKTAKWKNTKYVRAGKLTTKSRPERERWCCKLKDIQSASDKQLITMLRKHEILHLQLILHSSPSTHVRCRLAVSSDAASLYAAY